MLNCVCILHVFILSSVDKHIDFQNLVIMNCEFIAAHVEEWKWITLSLKSNVSLSFNLNLKVERKCHVFSSFWIPDLGWSSEEDKKFVPLCTAKSLRVPTTLRVAPEALWSTAINSLRTVNSIPMKFHKIYCFS